MTHLVSDEGSKALVRGTEGSTRVPATHGAEETEKLLNLLIHDLRAPLSVAQGYLRLLHQNKLESEADRQRAMMQSMEALGRISRLCEDATTFVAEPVHVDGPASMLPVSVVIERLTKSSAERGAPLTFVDDQSPTKTICIVNLDRVIHSLAVILGAVQRSAREPSVRVSVHEDAKEVRFLLGCDDDRAALESRTPETFDPWRGGYGIALPLACRIVTAAGGRIWTHANGRGAVGIALPEEASAP